MPTPALRADRVIAKRRAPSRHLRALPLLLAVAPVVGSSVGCVFDGLGWNETVTETSALFQTPVNADDQLSDKHPVFDPSRVVVEPYASCAATLDKSAALTKLDVVGFSGDDSTLNSALFHGYLDAAVALSDREIIPSMEVVEAALEPFDDGLFAAVEVAADDGSSGSPVSKRAMLNAVLAQLVATAATGAASEQSYAREAAAQIAAAISLSGDAPTAPSDVLASAASLVSAFDADPIASRPIGFYTWTSRLSDIYQRDRFLQAYASVAPSFGAQAATAHALELAGQTSTYATVLSLYAGMSDASFDRPVSDLLPGAAANGAFDDLPALEASFATAHPETTSSASCAAHLAVLPSSEGTDERVFRQLFCASTSPAPAHLLDVLVNLIRSGQIDLTPVAASGWSSRQLWALQTLLAPDTAPEKDNLFLTAGYKQKLIDTFQTILTENRETQAKQDGIARSYGVSAAGPLLIDLWPLLPVEPFPSYYLRTARAYSFVRTLLQTVMGPTFLTSAHRLLEDGTTRPESLDDELQSVILRMYGLYGIAADAIGAASPLTAEGDPAVDMGRARAAARAWVAAWTDDADLARDPRVIVPEFVDANAGTIHYWAMVGVQALAIEASYVPGFEPKVVDAPCASGKFVARDYTLLIGKTIDVAIPATAPPLTRAAFRAICDAHASVDDIAAALASQ